MKDPLNVKLEPEKVYDAISKGVENAIWRMITNATDMPCADFYDSIQKAATEAFDNVTITVNKNEDSSGK